jgi:hypothetical protein
MMADYLERSRNMTNAKRERFLIILSKLCGVRVDEIDIEHDSLGSLGISDCVTDFCDLVMMNCRHSLCNLNAGDSIQQIINGHPWLREDQSI